MCALKISFFFLLLPMFFLTILFSSLSLSLSLSLSDFSNAASRAHKWRLLLSQFLPLHADVCIQDGLHVKIGRLSATIFARATVILLSVSLARYWTVPPSARQASSRKCTIYPAPLSLSFSFSLSLSLSLSLSFSRLCLRLHSLSFSLFCSLNSTPVKILIIYPRCLLSHITSPL
ncbi:unnamed protein product [Acanthosepion pharaonis]|uniref:Uncharacterized protein n=1 Tax=Acanthosepion pharaonis TaxID=158019 RepID=A0A812B7M8_ACAPH|nr:unnamed protein product [Sepia pharaonis]